MAVTRTPTVWQRAQVWLGDNGEDEFGVTWDDPELGIDWPSSDPILSDRDMSNPTLSDVRGNAPAFEA